MSSIINVNVCRACMETDDGKSLMDEELQNKFTYATQLKIYPEVGLPSSICRNCEMKLTIAYDFIRLAQMSERRLMEFLQKVSNEFEIVREENKIEEGNACDSERQQHLPDMGLSATPEEERAEEQQESGTSVALLEPSRADINDLTDFACVNDTETTEDIQVDSTNQVEQNANDCEDVENQACLILDYEQNAEQLDGSMNGEDSIGTAFAVVDNSPYSHVNDDEYLAYEIQLDNYNNEVNGNDDDEEDNADVEIGEEANDGGQPMNDGQQQPLNIDPIMEIFDMPSPKGHVADGTALSTAQQDLLINEASYDYSTSNVYNDVDDDDDEEEEVPKSPLKDRTTARGRKRKRKSSEEPQSFYCSKCHRDFSSRTNLKRHMLTHEGVRPFNCEMCGKSFTQKSSLKMHAYTHTGEKPFVCKVCKRGFTQSKTLVFHMRRHTGYKPFSCVACNMAFRQKYALKVHMMKYHLVKEDDGDSTIHICIVCNELLDDTESLQLHMSNHVNYRHTKEEDKALIELIEFEKRQMQVEPVQLPPDVKEAAVHIVDVQGSSTIVLSRAMKFQCRKCGKSFSLQKSLLRHLKMHEN